MKTDEWKKTLTVVSNFVYVALASALSNSVQQFILYPAIERQVGEARYGEILVFITITNVCGLSFGGAAMGAYLTSRRQYRTRPGDFFCVLAVICTAVCGVSLAAVHGYLESPLEGIFLLLLIVLRIYYGYAFVDFQLTQDYLHYLMFEGIACCVDLCCLPLFYLTGFWLVLLLPGTAAALLYVWRRGRIFRHVGQRSENFRLAARDTATLSGAYLMDFGTQNADRFLLLPLMGGTSVTYYYVASLLSKTLALVSGPIQSLILGYFSGKSDPLGRKAFLAVNSLLLVGASVFFGGVVLLGPWLLGLPFLYPDLVEAVRPYLPLASAAQLLLITSSIIITIDLLVAPKRMQMLVQGTYMAVYVLLVFPFTLHSGLAGFVAASCVAAAVRYIVAVSIGWYYTAKKA